MFDRQKLDSQLMLDEGLRLVPYIDTRGYLTTGVGRNLDSNPFTPAEIAFIGHDGRLAPITHDQAIYLLHDDEAKAMKELSDFSPWWTAQPDIPSRVMLDLTFNMGEHTFEQFHQFLALMHINAYAKAGEDLQTTAWYGQVGNRGLRLVRMLTTGQDCV
jgi:GH24 family phage-related lysozyme (muramidase)